MPSYFDSRRLQCSRVYIKHFTVYGINLYMSSKTGISNRPFLWIWYPSLRVNVRLRLTLFSYKPPLLCYGNCPWKILVSIRTTWFIWQSKKACIKIRSPPASLLSVTVKMAYSDRAIFSARRRLLFQIACVSFSFQMLVLFTKLICPF